MHTNFATLLIFFLSYWLRHGFFQLQVKGLDCHGDKEVHLHEGEPLAWTLIASAPEPNEPLQKLLLLQVTLQPPVLGEGGESSHSGLVNSLYRSNKDHLYPKTTSL